MKLDGPEPCASCSRARQTEQACDHCSEALCLICAWTWIERHETHQIRSAEDESGKMVAVTEVSVRHLRAELCPPCRDERLRKRAA